ncbi:MAG: ABC transporter permease [Myxococcaceae bacterium]|nr:ABC transporter permease [Myxococcaceae bacterium]
MALAARCHYGAPALEVMKEIAVIWRGELLHALKTGRFWVLLVLFMMFTGMAEGCIGLLTKQASTSVNTQIDSQLKKASGDEEVDPETREQVKSKIKEQTEEGKKQIIKQLFAEGDDALTDALLAMPFVLLAVFKLGLRFLPFFAALIGFDQLSSEIGNRSVRYLVARARRSSLLLGKYAVQLTLLALLTLASTLFMVALSLAFSTDVALTALPLLTLKLWLCAWVLSVAYMGLTTLCSSLFRQPALSLFLNIIFLFVIWCLDFVGSLFRVPNAAVTDELIAAARPESFLAYLRYSSVWHYADDLMHPHWQRFLPAAFAHLGFAVIFLGLGYLVLRKRDL